jgi:RNA polymerase subunit RPABC4/transcription elongation factor Spt4
MAEAPRVRSACGDLAYCLLAKVVDFLKEEHDQANAESRFVEAYFKNLHACPTAPLTTVKANEESNLCPVCGKFLLDSSFPPLFVADSLSQNSPTGVASSNGYSGCLFCYRKKARLMGHYTPRYLDCQAAIMTAPVTTRRTEALDENFGEPMVKPNEAPPSSTPTGDQETSAIHDTIMVNDGRSKTLPNEERDKRIHELALDLSLEWGDITVVINSEFPEYQIDKPAVQEAAKRHAGRYGLPMPPRRKPGRRPQK